jgi:hypothetical protein
MDHNEKLCMYINTLHHRKAEQSMQVGPCADLFCVVVMCVCACVCVCVCVCVCGDACVCV